MKKRTIVQFLVAFISNSYIPGFINGTIFKGKSKYICLPGLNCYSCPGAIGSCPIGALQAVLGSAKYNVSLYIAGLMTFFGVFFGRFICGWLCPFGLIQDLLHKIKCKKLTVTHKLDKILRYLKYAMLLFLVILFPIFITNQFGIAAPYFCQFVCPAGTLEGGIPLILSNEFLRNGLGFLFSWKMFLLILTVGSAVVIYRPFCKYVCPLGAFYALFNKISFYHMDVDSMQCTKCKICESTCKMQVPVMSKPNHTECIRCGDCARACPNKAIATGFNLFQKK